MGVDRAQSCGCCPAPTGGGSAGLLEFSDYSHQKFTAAAVPPDALPEMLISQWACNFDPLGPGPIDVLLQLISASAAEMTYRVREGGTIGAPDGNILLQEIVQGADPTLYCFASLNQTPGAPCSLLKVTVESGAVGASVITNGIHLDVGHS